MDVVELGVAPSDATVGSPAQTRKSSRTEEVEHASGRQVHSFGRLVALYGMMLVTSALVRLFAEDGDSGNSAMFWFWNVVALISASVAVRILGAGATERALWITVGPLDLLFALLICMFFIQSDYVDAKDYPTSSAIGFVRVWLIYVLAGVHLMTLLLLYVRIKLLQASLLQVFQLKRLSSDGSGAIGGGMMRSGSRDVRMCGHLGEKAYKATFRMGFFYDSILFAVDAAPLLGRAIVILVVLLLCGVAFLTSAVYLPFAFALLLMINGAAYIHISQDTSGVKGIHGSTVALPVYISLHLFIAYVVISLLWMSGCTVWSGGSACGFNETFLNDPRHTLLLFLTIPCIVVLVFTLKHVRGIMLRSAIDTDREGAAVCQNKARDNCDRRGVLMEQQPSLASTSLVALIWNQTAAGTSISGVCAFVSGRNRHGGRGGNNVYESLTGGLEYGDTSSFSAEERVPLPLPESTLAQLRVEAMDESEVADVGTRTRERVSAAAVAQPPVSPAAGPVIVSPERMEPAGAAAVLAPKLTCTAISEVGANPHMTKVNQDRYLQLERMDVPPSDIPFAVYGVFDGHGPAGHNVAQFCTDFFARALLGVGRGSVDEPTLLQNLAKVFHHCQRDLEAAPSIADKQSGTTSVICYTRRRRLVCLGVGDSRAVLGQVGVGAAAAAPIAKRLSFDHTPENQTERERVENAGGDIRPMRLLDGTLYGPNRVFLAGKNAPGLMITRALGDTAARAAGVIADPQVWSTVTLDPGRDLFLIVASDGVWEFIEDAEAVRIVADAATCAEGCRALVDRAMERWAEEEADSQTRDDITAIVVEIEWQ